MVIKKFGQLSGSEVYEILKARSAVFMVEQGIRYLDMDGIDQRSVHFIRWDSDGAVSGYLRLYEDEEHAGTAQIGRVLTTVRGRGHGRELVMRAVGYARDGGYGRVCCDAQAQTVPFYEKCGFHRVSDEFTEAGIPHVRMQLDLDVAGKIH